MCEVCYPGYAIRCQLYLFFSIFITLPPKSAVLVFHFRCSVAGRGRAVDRDLCHGNEKIVSYCVVPYYRSVQIDPTTGLMRKSYPSVLSTRHWMGLQLSLFGSIR